MLREKTWFSFGLRNWSNLWTAIWRQKEYLGIVRAGQTGIETYILLLNILKSACQIFIDFCLNTLAIENELSVHLWHGWNSSKVLPYIDLQSVFYSVQWSFFSRLSLFIASLSLSMPQEKFILKYFLPGIKLPCSAFNMFVVLILSCIFLPSYLKCKCWLNLLVKYILLIHLLTSNDIIYHKSFKKLSHVSVVVCKEVIALEMFFFLYFLYIKVRFKIENLCKVYYTLLRKRSLQLSMNLSQWEVLTSFFQEWSRIIWKSVNLRVQSQKGQTWDLLLVLSFVKINLHG